MTTCSSGSRKRQFARDNNVDYARERHWLELTGFAPEFGDQVSDDEPLNLQVAAAGLHIRQQDERDAMLAQSPVPMDTGGGFVKLELQT